MNSDQSSARRRAAFTIIVASTLIGIAGTDLILPAVPSLPSALNTTAERAQYVLAAFVLGSAFGLIAFGTLGARYNQRILLVGSLLLYAMTSAIGACSSTLEFLVTTRFFQGAAGSAAAVFAPGMIRKLYGDENSVSALGLLSSIEALAPALAPIVGLWLLNFGGWPISFVAIAAVALLLALCAACFGRDLAVQQRAQQSGSYLLLLRNREFIRYALSHALTLGGLLVIVFASPSVFVGALGASLTDFIIMQAAGIAAFMIAANLSSRALAKWGTETVLWAGSWLALGSAVGILGLAFIGRTEPWTVTLLFIPFNIGLGLRGPAGFYRAVIAAHGDDARGAAIVVVAILVSAAAGTGLVAPFITEGLLPVGATAVAMVLVAMLLLRAAALTPSK
ncbi:MULTISPECIES: MFS transporter [Brucella]|uniref:MFS transporter n=1 Tax=Brucella sp. NBRC 113783 TaxID=3075478 RepID=UPI0028AF94BB|nr:MULTISPECIES: MFS transporter [Brucella]MDX4076066.1 MFS transporter [Brucella sp. NBRC 113783]